MATQIRQGDVLLVKVDKLPRDAQEKERANRIMLAYGEATGHSHVVQTREIPAVTFLAPDGSVFLQLSEPGTLVHEDHVPEIAVDPGIWIVPQQVEYTPAEVRRVYD